MIKLFPYYSYMLLWMFFSINSLTAHTLTNTATQTSAVTYTLSGGRFGDNLISYCHAKWFSFKHNVRLVYIPFRHSEHLQLHQLELHRNSLPANYFAHVVPVQRYDQNFVIEPNTLYVLPNFPEAELDREKDKTDNFKKFIVEWSNPNFKAELRKNIAPISPFSLLPLPTDKLTVAVHVRKNSNGFDGPLWYNLKEFAYIQGHINPISGSPAKFVPDKFYINNVKKLSDLLGNPPLYVFIFTDDKNPIAMMNNLKKQIDLPNIEFDCRKGRHDHTMHVLEDFFSMAQFDFLIRADSYFSLACAKIADFKIEIAPLLADLENNLKAHVCTLLKLSGK